MSAKSSRQQEVVKRLIDTKAVDFTAIGKIVAEIGPSLAVADEPWEEFCGTMRHFIRLYQLNNPLGPIEYLGELNKNIGNIR